MPTHVLRTVVVFGAIALLSLPLLCQQEQKSLGNVARESRKNGPRAKVVVDDDNINDGKEKPAIPDITLTGPSNTPEIASAIRDFKEKHSAQETEAAVRSWYDKHDAMLARAIRENITISELQRYGYARGIIDRPPDDDVRYMEWRTSQRMAASKALQDKDKSGLLSARLQQGLSIVRIEIGRLGLKYDWFKIRFSGGNGSY